MKTKRAPLKNYSVQLTGYCTVLVIGAESEEKAMEYARDGASRVRLEDVFEGNDWDA